MLLYLLFTSNLHHIEDNGLYYRVITLILVNIVPRWNIEGRSQARDNIHQYQCNNPFIIWLYIFISFPGVSNL